MEEKIILVDEKDCPIGSEEKLKVHLEGKLHRAFSIFIFNSKKELMLQKRAENKYHSGGLWTNTCCSHQRENEQLLEAVHRRLQEEMGFDCELEEIASFIYKTTFANNLTEHELDHVFIGWYDENPKVNPEEVSEFQWVDLELLIEDLENNPNKYTYWIKPALLKVVEYMKKN